MANNYYTATGVLVLDQVTPVITALFGAFELDASHPCEGKAYIAHDGYIAWSDIADRLAVLAAQLDLPAPSEDDPPTITSLLCALADHFGADQNEELAHLIEHHSFEDATNLDALLLIAGAFDDGHCLTAIEIEGCWRCDRPRLFAFGGDGCFLSRELSLTSESRQALALGRKLHPAVRANDVEACAELFAREILNLLASINDSAFKSRVRTRVIERLIVHAASHG